MFKLNYTVMYFLLYTIQINNCYLLLTIEESLLSRIKPNLHYKMLYCSLYFNTCKNTLSTVRFYYVITNNETLLDLWGFLYIFFPSALLPIRGDGSSGNNGLLAGWNPNGYNVSITWYIAQGKAVALHSYP